MSQSSASVPTLPAGRKSRGGLLILAALVLLPLLALGWILWQAQTEGSRPSAIRRAPVFNLPDQDGRSHHLEDYRGRSVALVFFERLDAEGREALRSIDRVMPEFDHAGVRVFAVGRETPEAQKRFHDDEKLDFPLLTDADGATAKAYRLEGRGAFILGPQGLILDQLQRVQPKRMGEQVATLAQCCLMPPDKQRQLRSLGKPLADFSLPRAADGRPESLFGDGQQKATVMVFLSAKCPCSKGYDQRVRELARDYQDAGVRVVAVYSSADETRDEVRTHARASGYTFPVLWDQNHHIADRVEARVTPEVFLMDRGRRIRYHGRFDDSRIAEEVKSHDLRNALDAVLAGHLPPKPDLPVFGCAITRVQNSASGSL